MSKDVTDYLVREHQELSLLLNELQQQLGILRLMRDRRVATERLSGLRRKISQAVLTHVAKEEQILYPALEDHMQGLAFTLDRMRHEHDNGKQTAEAFDQSLKRFFHGSGNPREVMQTGRKYVAWLRNHLLEEHGRLFPLVERGLDPATQQAVRQAMEELSLETAARVTEGQSIAAQA
jgi:hemerythrin-like domain-containing protein